LAEPVVDNRFGADEFGGEDYITAGNAAQIGNATSLTISNTDTASSGQYVGMAIWIELRAPVRPNNINR